MASVVYPSSHSGTPQYGPNNRRPSPLRRSPPSPRTTDDTHIRHLSEILQVDPEADGCCIGFAWSKNRRCTRHTSLHSRASAQSLLDRGTRMLQAGELVDDILEALAPLLLCRRSHQNDAPEMIEGWKRRVAACTEATAQRAQQTEEVCLMELVNRSIPPVRQFDELNRLLSITLAVSNALLMPPGQHSGSATEEPAEDSRAHGSAPESPFADGRYDDDGNEVENAAAETARPVETDRLTRVSPSTPTRAQDETSPATTHPPISEATRAQDRVSPYRFSQRPIEGDCPICMEPLLDDTELTSGDDLRMPGHPELIWCNAQCGVNLHKSCFEIWEAECLDTGRHVTCPLCRARWEEDGD